MTDESVPEADAIRPTVQRLSRGDVTVPIADRKNPQARPARASDSTPLGQYFTRKLLTPDQYLAGDRFRTIYARACILPRVTINPDRVGVGKSEPTDAMIAARQQLQHARLAIGPILYACIEAIVAHDKWADAWAQDSHLNARSGIDFLRSALDGLGKHFRGR